MNRELLIPVFIIIAVLLGAFPGIIIVKQTSEIQRVVMIIVGVSVILAGLCVVYIGLTENF